MPVAVVFLLRAVVLILLWGFVVAAVVAVRHDIFGTKPRKVRPPRPPRPTAAPKPARPPKPAKAPRASRAAPCRVAVIEGPAKGTSVALSSLPITIGRANDSTIVLEEDFASNKHARLVPNAGAWVLEDVGSTNGTLLGNSKVTAPITVKVGNRIKIGRSTLEIQ